MLTRQEIIDLLSEMYDNGAMDRAGVRYYLYKGVTTGAFDLDPEDVERIFDIVVG